MSQMLKFFFSVFLLVSSNTAENVTQPTNLTETFRYDVWEPTSSATWTTFDDMIMRYDDDDNVHQNYADLHAHGSPWHENYTTLTGMFKDPKHHNVTTTQALQTSDFEFLYGDIEWRAKISPSRNVLNVFRVGAQSMKRRGIPEARTENLELPVVQLVVQKAPKKSTWFRADVYFTPEQVPDGFSPDSSNLNATEWSMFRCKSCVKDLSADFHTYRLHWTPHELVWYINNETVLHMFNNSKIPSVPLAIGINLLVGRNFTALDDSDLLLSSVTVRQNRTVHKLSDVLGHEKFEVITDNFTNFNRYYWSIVDDVAVDSISHGDYSTLNEKRNVEVEEGVLRISTRLHSAARQSTVTSVILRQIIHATARYTVGRVDSTETMSLKYGEVEWRARMHAAPGIMHTLMLSEDYCGSNGCEGPFRPSINFNIYASGMVNAFIFYYNNATEKAELVHGQHEWKKYTALMPEDATHDYHLYRILWTSEMITWYIDDTEIDRFNITTKIPQVPMSISMRSTIVEDLDWPSSVNHSQAGTLEIDYIILRRNEGIDGPTFNHSETLLESTTAGSLLTAESPKKDLTIEPPKPAVQPDIATEVTESHTGSTTTSNPEKGHTESSTSTTGLPEPLTTVSGSAVSSTGNSSNGTYSVQSFPVVHDPKATGGAIAGSVIVITLLAIIGLVIYLKRNKLRGIARKMSTRPIVGPQYDDHGDAGSYTYSNGTFEFSSAPSTPDAVSTTGRR